MASYDLKAEEFKPSATAGSFDLTVGVKGATIGDKASEDNLKKLFGLEGVESLDFAAFRCQSIESVTMAGWLFYRGREGRITATCEAVAKRIEVVRWICRGKVKMA